jgi:hypothetical protein
MSDKGQKVTIITGAGGEPVADTGSDVGIKDHACALPGRGLVCQPE